MAKHKSFQKNLNEASASIPPEVREKILEMDRNEKAKRMTKRPQ
ncbi:MAG TPA: hypothetical protein VNM45_17340 [Bacillus sp. (in: firmicutes)]|nr:hypothetical protein [Bacillus sp. (in: firmicutes)]